MLRIICKSKIHHAKVTDANLRYMGSITIDSDLLEAADIFLHEKVQVVNLNNGSRIETYCIKGDAGSGTICMNGGAALHAAVGDELIIISYALADNKEAAGHAPKLVFLDEKNRILKRGKKK